MRSTKRDLGHPIEGHVHTNPFAYPYPALAFRLHRPSSPLNATLDIRQPLSPWITTTYTVTPPLCAPPIFPYRPRPPSREQRSGSRHKPERSFLLFFPFPLFSFFLYSFFYSLFVYFSFSFFFHLCPLPTTKRHSPLRERDWREFGTTRQKGEE